MISTGTLDVGGKSRPSCRVPSVVIALRVAAALTVTREGFDAADLG